MTVYETRRGISPYLAAGIVVLALAIGGAVGFVMTRTSSAASPPSQSKTGSSGRTGGSGGTGGSSSSSTTTKPTAVPLAVRSITPAANSVNVDPSAPIKVTFSAAVSSSGVTPRLSPSAPGRWRAVGDVLTFTPIAGFLPSTEVTVTVPAGKAGVRGADGGMLKSRVVEHFHVKAGSILRLQQLLSLLDYSPLSWQPSGTAIAPTDRAAQTEALVSPPAGSFAWRQQGWPSQLLALWKPGQYNVFTKGLVMSFEADHGLVPKGIVNRALWRSLIGAIAAHTVNTGGYNYALGNKQNPESLTVWHDGQVVIKTPANTGIASSPTVDGTFPVYSRLRSQVMKGTNPDGSHYADLVQYVAYFNGNDAVHYMPRPDYGIPQSLGCIELPLASAAKVWPYLAYGTLVSVIK